MKIRNFCKLMMLVVAGSCTMAPTTQALKTWLERDLVEFDAFKNEAPGKLDKISQKINRTTQAIADTLDATGIKDTFEKLNRDLQQIKEPIADSSFHMDLNSVSSIKTSVTKEIPAAVDALVVALAAKTIAEENAISFAAMGHADVHVDAKITDLLEALTESMKIFTMQPDAFLRSTGITGKLNALAQTMQEKTAEAVEEAERLSEQEDRDREAREARLRREQEEARLRRAQEELDRIAQEERDRAAREEQLRREQEEAERLRIAEQEELDRVAEQEDRDRAAREEQLRREQEDRDRIAQEERDRDGGDVQPNDDGVVNPPVANGDDDNPTVVVNPPVVNGDDDNSNNNIGPAIKEPGAGAQRNIFQKVGAGIYDKLWGPTVGKWFGGKTWYPTPEDIDFKQTVDELSELLEPFDTLTTFIKELKTDCAATKAKDEYKKYVDALQKDGKVIQENPSLKVDTDALIGLVNTAYDQALGNITYTLNSNEGMKRLPKKSKTKLMSAMKKRFFERLKTLETEALSITNADQKVSDKIKPLEKSFSDTFINELG